MAKTENDLTINKTWQDLVTTYPGLANNASYVQNKGFGSDRRVLVYFSESAAAPTGANGMSLSPGGSAKGTAGHIWVRAFRDDVVINCGTTD